MNKIPAFWFLEKGEELEKIKDLISSQNETNIKVASGLLQGQLGISEHDAVQKIEELHTFLACKVVSEIMDIQLSLLVRSSISLILISGKTCYQIKPYLYNGTKGITEHIIEFIRDSEMEQIQAQIDAKTKAYVVSDQDDKDDDLPF